VRGEVPGYPPGVRPFRAGDEAPILAAMLAALERGDYEGVTRHFLEESARRLRRGSVRGRWTGTAVGW
jgi:hypothetical protein